MNSKSISLFFLCAILSFASFADSATALSVIPTANASVYNVHYKAKETGNIKVSVFNNKNQLLFSEVLNNVGSFSRPYNFSELPEGEYTIVLEDKNGKQVEKVNYFMSKVKSVISVTEVANAEDKYKLNVTNNGTEAVTVKIYDNTNTLIHEQNVEVTGHFGLIYNLSQVKSASTVTFEVITSTGIERVTF